MFSASKNVDSESVESVKTALIKLSPESSLAEEVLEKTEWGGFVEPTGRELAEINELVEEYSVPLFEK